MFGLKNRTVSYVDSHNNAVIRYRRCCKAFIWVGVVNFVGLIVGIIQYYAQGTESSVPFYYCFGVCDMLFSALYGSIHIAWFYVIVAATSLLTTSGAVLLGLFASYGKKRFLYTMAIVYLVDWVVVILNYALITRNLIGLLINAGIHAIATFFIIMAIYQYYNVINIEKRFKNIPTVAETKEKEKQMESQENVDEHQS